MNRTIRILLVVLTLVPGAAAVAMAANVPPSAYVVPTLRFATPDGAMVVTPHDLGAVRTDDGLRVDHDRLQSVLDRLGKALDRPGEAASYVLSEDQANVALRPGTAGTRLARAEAEAVILRALRTGGTGLRLPMETAPAPPAPKDAIVVNLGRFQLDLFNGTAHKQRYTVGVGALRFPTPPGVYFVRSKAKNPTWRNPGSSWARSMPSYIGPGPRNPLGTRALRLDRGALVIHGTPQPWSVGQRSSHGCIRMRRADVESLYEKVPVGTPVFIVP